MCIVIQQAYAYVSIKSVFFCFFFRLFTKLGPSINRPVNVTYNNVLNETKWGNSLTAEDSVLRISNRY